MMDVELLSRIQFAFTVGFHIIFPSLNIGLAFFLFLLEALWLKTGNELYLRAFKYWLKIFALAFGVGVVSGLVLSYELGANWSRFTEIGGHVLGPLISYEVLTAFFLEAGFLGIMLFGMGRVGPKLHFFATSMVAFGTLFSAFWILSANSWMQTPYGFEIINGKIHVASWWDVIFNPSFPHRLFHMILASFIAASVFVAGISAYWLLKRKHFEVACSCFSITMGALVVLTPLQIYVGDAHGLNTLKYQPMKIAAIEAIWETQKGADLLLFALPDEKAEKNDLEIGIPHLASLILTHRYDGELKGLKSVSPKDRPPVAIVFWSFRAMVGIGLLLLLLAVTGLVLRFKNRLYDTDWFARAMLWSIPLPFLAVLFGWTVTEVGRQPYTVYGLLRTSESLAPHIADSLWFSLLLFTLVYGFVFVAFLFFLIRMVKKGPASAEQQVYLHHNYSLRSIISGSD